MSAHQHLESATHGRARLSFASDADIDEFAAVLGQFERGEITPEQWRVFRLVRGTYGQRQLDDAQMIRVKIPQGMLTAAQLDVAGRRRRAATRAASATSPPARTSRSTSSSCTTSSRRCAGWPRPA